MQKVTLFKQDEVVDYLLRRCKPLAAELIENLSYNVGLKGQRFPDFILAQSVSNLVAPKLMRELECEVTQVIHETQSLYYVGVLPHNVKLNKGK